MCSSRSIAKQLNRHHSTIFRELKRNRTMIYQVEIADELAQYHPVICQRLEKKSEEVIQIIQNYLKLTGLLEQIFNTVQKLLAHLKLFLVNL